MDANAQTARAEFYRDTLLNDVLPFWIRHGVDHNHGGFRTSLDQDGTVIDPDKGIWQQGRFTWLLGELYNNVEPRDEWLTLAQHGSRYIIDHGFDPSDGRMWFQVNQTGVPVRKRRYAFSESFAAIAFGELAQATNDERCADLARKTFREFVDHNLCPAGTTQKYTEARPMKGLGFPMICVVTAQELRASIGLEDADEWIDRAIEEIQRDFMKPDLRCVMETVGLQGEVLDCYEGRTLNPGHAIEGAWFIFREAVRQNDGALIRTGCDMLDWMWERGWDDEFGGLLYFADVHGRPVQEYWHDMKFWWPHCELIIACLWAWKLTGQPRFLKRYEAAHRWAFDHFPDAAHGEWFGYLHRDGRVSSRAKGNTWKGPFHLPRMLLTCWQLLQTDLDHAQYRG